MMSDNTTLRTSVIAKTFVLILAMCYLLSPLQQSMKLAIHDISHAISQVQAEQHTHNHLMQTKMGRRALAHHHHQGSHQHSVLSFFDKLFNDDQSSHQQQNTIDFNIDKHIETETSISFNSYTETQQHQFFYNGAFLASLIPIDSPPPEYFS